MIDTRQALSSGSKVKSQNGIEYEIAKEVGRGASCIVYEGQYKDQLNNFHHIRIKELYPYDLEIGRTVDNTLLVPEGSHKPFQAACEKFLNAYSRNVELHNKFGIVNSTMAPVDQFQFGGSWYMVSTCTEGQDYASIQDPNVQSVFRRIKTISSVIQKYHNEGYLYLDLKPENIFIIPETDELIVLFDFDSILRTEELNENSRKRISFSTGYAAPELVRSNRRKICEATDIYSIGAIAFQKLFGHVPSSMDGSISSEYDFESMKIDEEVYPALLFKYLTEFFHKTLSASTGYRYKTIAEMLPVIEKIIKYSDLDAQYLLENFSYSSANFIGRTKELSEIDDSLHKADVVFLSGIGGIGKTELAKKYANSYRDNYSKIAFLTFQDSIKDTVCSDDLAFHNLDMDGDSADSYFNRKMLALRQEMEESDDKRPILLILDNFDVDEDDDLDEFLDCGCKIIITSRTDFSDYDYPQIDIGKIDSTEELKALFESYNPAIYTNEETEVLYDLFDLVDGHTMTVVLIAKYLRESLESPSELKARFISVGGLNNTDEDIRVKHRKDKKHRNKNVINHLRILFDVSGVSEAEKEIMRSFSLLGYVRIKKEVLLEILSGLEADRELDMLIRHGWIEYDENSGKVSLHQVILDLMFDQLQPTSENCPNFMDGFYNYLQEETDIYQESVMKDKLCDILFQRLDGHDYRYARLCVLRRQNLDVAEQICSDAAAEPNAESKYYFLLAEIMKIKADRIGGNTNDYVDAWNESTDDEFSDKKYVENKLNRAVSIVRKEIAYIRKATTYSEELIKYFLDIVKDLDSFFEECAFWYMDDETYQIIWSLQLELINEVDLLLSVAQLEDEDRLNYLVILRDFFGANLVSFQVVSFEHYTDLKAAFKYQKQVDKLREKLYPETIFADANDLSLQDLREEVLDNEDLKDWENLVTDELDEDDSLVLENINKLIYMYKQVGDNAKAVEMCKSFIEKQSKIAAGGKKTFNNSSTRNLFTAHWDFDSEINLEATVRVYYTLAELLVTEGDEEKAMFYLKDALAKFFEQSCADLSVEVLLIKIYDLLIQISAGKEQETYQEKLKITIKQYYNDAGKLSEEITPLLVKYIDEEVPKKDRFNALDNAIRRYVPCCTSTYLPENDLLFHYAEKVCRESGDAEKLFELLLYHVRLLQEHYTYPPREEEEILLKEMQDILEHNEHLNEYYVALYHKMHKEYYDRCSGDYRDQKEKEAKLCDFYLLAETDSRNEDYSKRIDLWNDAQWQYGSISEYEKQLRCFEQLNIIWEELYGTIQFNRWFYEYARSIYNEMECYAKLNDYTNFLDVHAGFLEKIQNNCHTVYKEDALYNAVTSNAFSLEFEKQYPEAFHAYVFACIVMFNPKPSEEKMYSEFVSCIHREDLTSEQIYNLLDIADKCLELVAQGYKMEDKYRKEFDWIVNVYREHDIELKRK